MKKIKIERADTPEKIQTGLMYRKTLADDSGMLFSFDSPRNLSFWGQNTYIPLDIAFVDEDMKISEIKEIVPMSTRPVTSRDKCQYVIEANLEYFKTNGIEIGTEIKIDTDHVIFG